MPSTLHPGAIEVTDLAKSYRRKSGHSVKAVDGLSLVVNPGEITAVVGPSGCGKTTLLRCVAGLERPDSGTIRIGGEVVSGGPNGIFLRPEARGIGMMFQTYALWPHMSVAQNVAYPLRSRGASRSTIESRVDMALKNVGLDGLQAEQPSRLSGGQQQRVALARSLVAEPQVILFDEPLSNVDAKVREELRVELVRMHQDVGFTGLYVTHDQEEALQVGDRLAIMKHGRLEQEGEPIEVYRNPASTYVAEFLGVTNSLPGEILPSTDAVAPFVIVETEVGPIAVDHARVRSDTDRVTVIFRPRTLQMMSSEPSGIVNSWRATITAVMFRGTSTQYLVSVGSLTLRVWSDDGSFAEGLEVWVCLSPEDAMVRPRESGPAE